MRLRIFLVLSLTVLLSTSLAAPFSAAAQAPSDSYFIFNVDKSKYPQVSFSVRATDVNNRPKGGLTAASLAVFENGQPVKDAAVTPREGPIHYILIVDMGQFSLATYPFFPIATLKSALAQIASPNFFRDNVDTLTVLARQNVSSDQTVELIQPEPAKTAAQISAFFGLFTFKLTPGQFGGQTAGLSAIQDALNTYVPSAGATVPQPLFTDPGAETTAIIYLTRFLEVPPTPSQNAEAQNTANQAVTHNTLVYVMQTDSSLPARMAPLQSLASLTHGQYIAVKPSTVMADAATILGDIASQRTVYDVSYRSTSADASPRVITVNSAEAKPGQQGTYQVTVNPPTVTISEPADNFTFTRGGANSIQSVDVKGSVSFSDNPRKLQTVELFADGAAQQQPGDAFEPGSTSFDLKWDPSDVTESKAVKLQVKVTDELGLTATQTVTVNVKVEQPTSTPVPTPTSIFNPGGGGTGSPINIIGSIIAVICLGLACLLPLSGLIFYITRPAQAKKVVKDIQNTLIGGAPVKSKALATITVIEGPKGLIGEAISVTKAITTLGRNPKMADIVFYPDEESSVSRLHCTIQLDGKVFKLTDNNSTSGTRLNGRRLSPNDPSDLADGDEITLGDLGKLGVKVKFSFLMDKTQLPSSGTASDKTFIMDDYDKDDWDKYKDH